jgi:hypothetical protein
MASKLPVSMVNLNSCHLSPLEQMTVDYALFLQHFIHLALAYFSPLISLLWFFFFRLSSSSWHLYIGNPLSSDLGLLFFFILTYSYGDLTQSS